MTPNEEQSGPTFTVNQQVEVERRAWAGINKPGGVGHITEIHFDSQGFASSVDVKYILGGSEKFLDLDFVKPHEHLGRRNRVRNKVMNVGPPPSPKRRKKNNTAATAAKTKKATKKTAPTDEHESDPPPLCDVPPAEAQVEETSSNERFPVPSTIEISSDSSFQAEISPLPTDRGIGATAFAPSMPSQLAPSQAAVSLKKKSSSNIVAAVDQSKHAANRELQADINKKKGASRNSFSSSNKAPSAKKALKDKLAKASKDNDGNKKPRAKKPAEQVSEKKQEKTAGSLEPTRVVPKTEPSALKSSEANDSKKKSQVKTSKPSKPAEKNTKKNATSLESTKLLQHTKPVEPKFTPRVSPEDNQDFGGIRVPLKDVYDNKLQSAKEFVSGVVGENTKKKLVVKPTTSFTMDPSRQEKFVGIFSFLLHKMDGEMVQQQVLRDVNEKMGQECNDEPFSMEEMKYSLKHLSDSGKIMVGEDGNVYSL